MNYTFKLTGSDAAESFKNAVDIALNGDGTASFVDAIGTTHRLPVTGPLAVLFKRLFSDPDNGITSGMYFFDAPTLSGPGLNGRTDN